MKLNFITTRSFATAGWLLHAAGGVGLILLALSGFGFHHATTRELRALAEQRSEAIMCQRNAGAFRRKFAETQARLNAVQSQTRVLRERLRPTADASTFLARISQLAETAGISIRRFQPNQSVSSLDGGGFAARDIALDCEGSHADLCEFLLALQGSREMCQIVSLSVTGADNAQLYQIQLQMRLYSQPLAAASANSI